MKESVDRERSGASPRRPDDCPTAARDRHHRLGDGRRHHPVCRDALARGQGRPGCRSTPWLAPRLLPGILGDVDGLARWPRLWRAYGCRHRLVCVLALQRSRELALEQKVSPPVTFDERAFVLRYQSSNKRRSKAIAGRQSDSCHHHTEASFVDCPFALLGRNERVASDFDAQFIVHGH